MLQTKTKHTFTDVIQWVVPKQLELQEHWSAYPDAINQLNEIIDIYNII